MKQKFKILMMLMCLAFFCNAYNGAPRWYGNNHFRIVQKENMVRVAMSKMPWESFSVNLNDVISSEGYLSFEVKSENAILLRVDGFTADNQQVELFSEEIAAGKFKELFYNLASTQSKIEHLIIYVNPGKEYKGEVQFKGLKSTSLAEEKKAVTVFPNPTHGDVSVQLPDNTFNQVVLQDASGNVLSSKSAQGSQVLMNLNNQKPGIYIIKAKGRNAVVTTKIIKD